MKKKPEKKIRKESRIPKSVVKKVQKNASKLKLTWSAYVTMILTKFG